MQIKLDTNDTVISWCRIGGIEGGTEVDHIPEDVMVNCKAFRYVDGKFTKDGAAELEQVKKDKCSELASACEQTIISGFAVGDKHYSFTVEDQANILAWAEQAKAGKSVPYHADGELCRVYTAAEFLQIVGAATYYKVSQQTYHNCLKQQVMSMVDVNTVKAVQYGITGLTGAYKETYDNIMAVIASETAD